MVRHSLPLDMLTEWDWGNKERSETAGVPTWSSRRRKEALDCFCWPRFQYSLCESELVIDCVDWLCVQCHVCVYFTHKLYTMCILYIDWTHILLIDLSYTVWHWLQGDENSLSQLVDQDSISVVMELFERVEVRRQAPVYLYIYRTSLMQSPELRRLWLSQCML